jgi:hypothetical protein
MDLNSYLTEFFSMINNNNNIFGGNGYMRGGVKPPGVSFDESTVITNDDILYYYFKKPTDPSFKPSVDNSDKLIFRNDALKAEFIENQVKIVEYMLDRNHTQYGGGMYGGGELEDAKGNLATEEAKAEQDQDKALIASLQAKIAGLEAANAAAVSAAAAAAAAVESAASKPAATVPNTLTLTLETSFIEYMKTKDEQYNPTKILVDSSTKEDFKAEFDVLPKKSQENLVSYIVNVKDLYDEYITSSSDTQKLTAIIVNFIDLYDDCTDP